MVSRLKVAHNVAVYIIITYSQQDNASKLSQIPFAKLRIC
jgi:hypothetical protein